MDISTRPVADGVVGVKVSGEIDMATVAELEAALVEALHARDVTTVIVDFALVSFCDSSGLAALDQAYGLATRRGIVLRLTDVQPAVARVLQIVGMFDTLITRPYQA